MSGPVVRDSEHQSHLDSSVKQLGLATHLKKEGLLVSLKGSRRASAAAAAMSEPEEPSVRAASKRKSPGVRL